MGNNSYFLIGIIFFWLGLLSYLFYRLGKHYDKLSSGITKTGLREVLENILGKTKENEIKTEKLEEWCQKLEKETSFCIQKIGLLRFNPFSDTGGDQSFILSITDKHNSGIVLTSLHSRTGTRWYAKSVKNGKGIEHELSNEEEKVIKEAKSI